MGANLDPFDPDTWSKEERHYFEKVVGGALESRENLIISNSRTEHALYLIHLFLENTETKMRLFSGNLCRKSVDGAIEIYSHPKVVKAVKGLLLRGASLEIVVQDTIDVGKGQPPASHPVVQAAEELHNAGELQGGLEVRKAKSEAIDWLKRKKFGFHWMTMDETGHRLEVDIERFKAHVNFGNQERTEGLNRLFDKLLFAKGETLAKVSGTT